MSRGVKHPHSLISLSYMRLRLAISRFFCDVHCVLNTFCQAFWSSSWWIFAVPNLLVRDRCRGSIHGGLQGAAFVLRHLPPPSLQCAGTFGLSTVLRSSRLLVYARNNAPLLCVLKVAQSRVRETTRRYRETDRKCSSLRLSLKAQDVSLLMFSPGSAVSLANLVAVVFLSISTLLALAFPVLLVVTPCLRPTSCWMRGSSQPARCLARATTSSAKKKSNG